MGQDKKETIQFFPDRPSQVPPPADPADPALDKALKDSFPASDPPSNLQPRNDEEVASAEEAARLRADRDAKPAKRNAG